MARTKRGITMNLYASGTLFNAINVMREIMQYRNCEYNLYTKKSPEFFINLFVSSSHVSYVCLRIIVVART